MAHAVDAKLSSQDQHTGRGSSTMATTYSSSPSVTKAPHPANSTQQHPASVRLTRRMRQQQQTSNLLLSLHALVSSMSTSACYTDNLSQLLSLCCTLCTAQGQGLLAPPVPGHSLSVTSAGDHHASTLKCNTPTAAAAGATTRSAHNMCAGTACQLYFHCRQSCSHCLDTWWASLGPTQYDCAQVLCLQT
jgi:hypothetical protein